MRIDDLDRERAEERYVKDVFETLGFLGLTWDEGPVDFLDFEGGWSQVHRMGLYRAGLERLREQGVLYACNCSRTQIARAAEDGGYPGTCRDKGIALDAPDVSWRVRTDMEREIAVKTTEGQVRTVLDGSMKDFVVRKKDGFPAYQLTSVIDDLHFGVDLIVRGQDLWASTLAQQYLATLLPGGQAFSEAVFHHHVLLKDADGGKLSKSAGATSIQYLRGQGLEREEIYGLISPLL